MGRFSLQKKEYKLSDESAQAAVMALVTFYEFDIDAIPDEDGRKIVEASATKLVQYYRMGLIENVQVDGSLSVKQHLLDPPGEVKDIVYGRMDGRAKLSTDGFGENARYRRMYALMDHLSQSVSGTIETLRGVDLAVAENLGAFFLLGSS